MICFFFNDTATTEIYTLSLHDALPICPWTARRMPPRGIGIIITPAGRGSRSSEPSSSREAWRRMRRSEEHTSELQSRQYLVCRLLLEKKKNWRIEEVEV